MFVRRKTYKALVARVDHLQKAIAERSVAIERAEKNIKRLFTETGIEPLNEWFITTLFHEPKGLVGDFHKLASALGYCFVTTPSERRVEKVKAPKK